MRDVSYKTPFLIASRHGHLETLSWLLQYNADVAAIDKDDKTCLMLAAEENKPDTIRVSYSVIMWRLQSIGSN